MLAGVILLAEEQNKMTTMTLGHGCMWKHGE